MTSTQARSPIVKRGLTIGYIAPSWLDVTASGILLLILLVATLGRDRASAKPAAAGEARAFLGRYARQIARRPYAPPARAAGARTKGLPVYVLRDVVEDDRGG